MEISEKITFEKLPQVKDFSFLISGINISDFNPVSFEFYDIGSNYFSFNFQDGFLKIDKKFLKTNKIIYAYNNKELINIEGHIKNNKLFFKINDVVSDTDINFSNLNKIIINNIDTTINFDIFINSNPINYSFQVNENYPYQGILSGKINTDIPFYVKDYSLLFYNSNIDLLSGVSNLTGKISSGSNNFTLKDIDASNFQYLNSFSINFKTIFGDLFNQFSSYRDNFYNKKTISLNENLENIYNKSLLFDGIWTNNSFIYSKNIQNFNLNYLVQQLDYFGSNLKTPITLIFEPFQPLNNDYYTSEYITGFSLLNSGIYSGEVPSLTFSKYFYVDGVQQSLNNLLFSTGCQNTIRVNYSGNSTGEASGYLNLRNVRLNNFYGNGINTFKAAFDYISYSQGSGYTEAPTIIWNTGGNCFSIADVYGESGQFKKINNTKSKIKAHADYLNGLPLTSGITGEYGEITGYVVTGINMTNIGSGYNSTFPPKVNFIRSQNDLLNKDATGIFNYKQRDLYNFTGNWSMDYYFSNVDINQNKINPVFLNNKYFFSGDIIVPFDKNSIFLNINLSGLDHTSPISGLLTIKAKNESEEKTIQKYIVNNRYYKTN